MLAILFYKQIATACKSCGEKVKMHPSAIMAQLGNETGHVIGPHKNLTNIKYFGPHGTGFQNGIYWLKNDVIPNGPKIAYENYATIEQWGKAYVKVLNGNLYKACHGLATTEDTCHALGNSPFAESGYRYGNTTDGWHGTRGQVLIDMIKSNNLKMYDKGYNPKGASNVVPVTNNNQDAVNKAKAKALADAKAQKLIMDKLYQEDLRDEIAEQNMINKATLTRNAQAILIAQAKAKTDALARKNAIALAEKNRIIKEKANALAIKNAHASNNSIPNTIEQPKDAKSKTLPKANFDISKTKVFKSSFSLIGVVLIGLVLYNAELPTTELE